MIRFARVLVIALMTVVLSAAVTPVSAADAGKGGSTVTMEKRGTFAPGHLHQVSGASVQGYEYEFFGQYINYALFYWYMSWNYKFYFSRT